MKHYKLLLICAVGIILMGTGFFFWQFQRDTTAMGAQSLQEMIAPTALIIDAGHGGEDGGAVSLTGVSESQINLAIALRVEDTLALYGVPITMLRREDKSLHDETATTLRQKKVSDLHNRVAEIENTPNAVLISIHQNSFPQGKYSGAQVFYAPTEGAQPLAEHVQQIIQQALQPENNRQAKPIPDSVYLMNHITCPAILVECGFLTNPEEEQLLRQSNYQTKFAAVLSAAYLTANAG